MSRRYIDADLPCVSDDRPTRAELAAERDGEKYNEGHSDGHAIGHDEGRAEMHAEVMEAIREMLEEHCGDTRDYTAADIISMVHDAVAALADDADAGQEVPGPSEIKVATEWPAPLSHHAGGEAPAHCRICDAEVAGE